MQNRIHHLLWDRTFWGVLTRAAPISHGLGGRAEHRSIAKVVKRRRKEVAGAWGGGAARAMLSSERTAPRRLRDTRLCSQRPRTRSLLPARWGTLREGGGFCDPGVGVAPGFAGSGKR